MVPLASKGGSNQIITLFLRIPYFFLSPAAPPSVRPFSSFSSPTSLQAPTPTPVRTLHLRETPTHDFAFDVRTVALAPSFASPMAPLDSAADAPPPRRWLSSLDPTLSSSTRTSVARSSPPTRPNSSCSPGSLKAPTGLPTTLRR